MVRTSISLPCRFGKCPTGEVLKSTPANATGRLIPFDCQRIAAVVDSEVEPRATRCPFEVIAQFVVDSGITIQGDKA